ncbi:MAG: hypothetical protein M3Z07_01765 [Candidatus Eremiobacteraeota bacterium]|nr:hypothetical protein [Candidatus Eremiobacteraeota bacterium]
MENVTELLRAPSPAPRPQALAFDGETLWMGSIDTQRIYAIDPIHWTVREEHAAPGKPWGMTSLGDELRVICGETAEDNRIIRRYVPGHGFKSEYGLPCPDDTGSQLGYDGEHLSVSQWYNKRILVLDERGHTLRTIAAPRGICGQVVVDGAYHLLTTDDEDSERYFVTRIDPATGASTDLARVPFAGRALAHDGHKFWTNERERNEIVAFSLPGIN